MKWIIKNLCFLVLSTFIFSILTNRVQAQEKEIKAELPVLVVSCGQSPGPLKYKVFMKRLKLDYDYQLSANAEYLQKRKKEGKQIKTLIIVTGASLKGMGAAGVSIKDEIARTKKLIAEAKKQNIKIIGSHIEGMARRSQGANAGDNSDEMTIDEVCPKSDLLIIRKDGDADGRFSVISKGKNIPMIIFEKNMEIGKVIKNLFSK